MKAYGMKANTRDQRAVARRGLRRLTVVGATLAVLVTGACGSTEAAKPSAGGATPAAVAAAPAVFDNDHYLKNAGDFVDAAKDTWDATKKDVKVELGEDADGKMFFKPKDLVLEAGKPHEITMVNIGKTKHELTADKFFRSAAVRKIDTETAEVKAPFFTEIEVLAGKTVKLFVIPVTTGSFEMLCELPGHRELGMEGTITVTGKTPAAPLGVMGSVKEGKWVQNAADLLTKPVTDTWKTTAQKRTIEAGEQPPDANGKTMFFKDKETVLKVGVPTTLTLVNVTTTKTKHEWAADTFFPTIAFRKAEDTFGEYKTPLLSEAEVKPGGKLDLFFIPTQVGTFEIECALPGHKEAGMVGTVKVTK